MLHKAVQKLLSMPYQAFLLYGVTLDDPMHVLKSHLDTHVFHFRVTLVVLWSVRTAECGPL